MSEVPRVVVTRTVHQAPAFCRKLADAGFHPIAFPAIRLEALPPEPLDAALDEITSFDWLVFTSGNAVDFFFARVEERALAPTWPQVAASGAATARKLAAREAPVSFIPDEFVGEELVSGLGDLTGRRVLLPRAKIGRPKIVELLQDQGAVVTEAPLYDTVTAVPTPEDLAKLAQGFEAVTFTSPSSVRNFLKIIDERPQRFVKPLRSTLETAVVVCIGPITAEAASERGLTVTLVPDEYTIDGMVQALAVYYQKENGRVESGN